MINKSEKENVYHIEENPKLVVYKMHIILNFIYLSDLKYVCNIAQTYLNTVLT